MFHTILIDRYIYFLQLLVPTRLSPTKAVQRALQVSDSSVSYSETEDASVIPKLYISSTLKTPNPRPFPAGYSALTRMPPLDAGLPRRLGSLSPLGENSFVTMYWLGWLALTCNAQY